jgi:ubiquinone/menaquinone biosynthesis C-methylase UbiE
MSAISSKDYFGKNASKYATSQVHKSGPSLPVLIDLAAPTENDIALDIATGTGHTSIALAPFVKTVTGLDLTPRMLEEARRLAAESELTNTSFVEGSAEALPFPASTFSLVTSRHAPHHFRHADRFLSEVLRVLRPSGRFLMSDQIAPTSESFDWIDFWERTRDPSHFRQRTVAEWERLAADAGLRWITHRIVPYRLEFDWWVNTAGANGYAVAALENHARAADESVRASCGLEFDENGRVKAFRESMLVVRCDVVT